MAWEFGELVEFNQHDAYLVSMVKGFRSGFLTETEYHHLCQCDTLDDVKLNFQETDYGSFLQNEPSPLAPRTVEEKAREKLVMEFEYLRAHAADPLATFLDFVTYEFMIENVMLLLKGSLNGTAPELLLEESHPLGRFTESTMRAICAFEGGSSYQDLCETVLIDTPVGKYFSEYLRDQSEKMRDSSVVRGVMKEVEISVMKSSIMKLYLEDFYLFCMDIEGETALQMADLLKARADGMAINITLNSFDTPLGTPAMREDRKALFPSIGFLYPGGTDKLSRVDDEGSLGLALAPYVAYSKIWDLHMRGEKSIDDAFYEREVRLCELAFSGQHHYACFYAYVRLREQEIRNIVWICECIMMGRKDRIDKYLPIFSPTAPWRMSAGGGGGAGSSSG
eukprot:PLAT15903.1.p2 GENE.PLAT15903.1~~PLAT15903.1.p2  ORF type:complete len:394 (-),score=208.31 PLAT15903.1:129-1310(-)